MIIAVGTTLIGLLIIDWNHDWDVWNGLFYPDLRPGDGVDSVAKVRFWTAKAYNLALLMGLPVAFLVWHWRDKNARDQIENARKDINLKEFQEVQGRAAGLFDQDMPESAREQLQIAALHQLRAFLRGEYGDAFRRPAFELILAGHAEAMDRIGMGELKQQFLNKFWQPDAFVMGNIEKSMRSKLDRVMRERIIIIREEAEAIFSSEFPLNRRNYDFCTFSEYKFPKKSDLSRSSFVFSNFSNSIVEECSIYISNFIGSDLGGANFKNSWLFYNQFDGSDLSWAEFNSSDLSNCRLRAVDAGRADFTGTKLQFSVFRNSILEKAKLDGAYLYDTEITNSKLSEATFNKETKFFRPKHIFSEEDLNSQRQKLLIIGAKFVE